MRSRAEVDTMMNKYQRPGKVYLWRYTTLYKEYDVFQWSSGVHKQIHPIKEEDCYVELSPVAPWTPHYCMDLYYFHEGWIDIPVRYMANFAAILPPTTRKR